MTNHQYYEVKKLRFGKRGGVEWNPWEYEAVSRTAIFTSADNAERGATRRHPSLRDLASELANFPGIETAEFFPCEEKKRRVSLSNNSLTQYRVVTDEELGELALEIQQQRE